MDRVHALHTAFEAWAAGASRDVVAWANPAMGASVAPPTAGWAFTRLDHALLAVAAYGCVVAVGLLRYSRAPRGGAAGEASLKRKLTLGEAFRAEPIRVLQVLYNAAQVLLCAVMIAGTALEARRQGYSLMCNAYKMEGSGISFWLWVFYLSKIFDFMDTVIMVVRGKFEQFTFLHVYHHISIFLIYWLNTVSAYDGDVYYTIIANSFVHLVMYYYYLQQTLLIDVWWKKYLTQLQMVQFVTMMSQAVYILYNRCPYPRAVTLLYLFYIFSLLILFMRFYFKMTARLAREKRGKAA